MKKISRLILINTLIFLLLLFTLEIGFRILGFGYGFSPLENDPIFHHVHPKNYSFKSYTPNGEFGGHTINYDKTRKRIHINSKEKDSDEEIWFFGDSFTEALQQDWKDSFVGIVDSLVDYKVTNYGTSSYSPILYLIQLNNELKKNKKPKIAFIQIYSNDVEDDERYKISTVFNDQGLPISSDGGTNSWIKTILRKSYLARVVKRAQITMQFMQNEEEIGETSLVKADKYIERSPDLSKSPDFTSNIRKLDSIFVAEGIEHYFFGIPSKYSCITGDWETPTFSSKFNEFLEENSYPYIDLTESFKRISKSEKVFYEKDIHCNTLGNRLISQEILKKIKE